MTALALGLALFSTALAKEQKAEIKLFVAEEKIDEAKKQIDQEFHPKGPMRHQIYFFDTDGLGLYKTAAGPVILRARQKEDQNGEKERQSTVKLRRDKPDADLEKKLAELTPKLEVEIEPEAIVGRDEPPGISYSLDATWDKSLSELEGASGKAISEWFSADQKRFLEAAGIKIEWTALHVFGRIDAEVWEWKEADERVDAKITEELWPLGDNRILELSCKKKGGDVARHKENFAAFCKDKKIPAAENPASKTKQALDYFSKRTTATPTPAAAKN